MDNDTQALAQMIYAESGSTDHETMVRVGSTALNRLEANKPKEFGSNLPEVLHKGYYAVSNPNDPMKWATTGKFPNADEENRFKEAMSIAYGLQTGSIERQKGEFYFTPKEQKRLKKSQFDFTKVKNVGSTDTYNFYSY